MVTGSANGALMGTSTLEGWSIISHLHQWSTSSPHYCSSVQHHVILLQLLVLTYLMDLLFGTFSYVIVCPFFWNSYAHGEQHIHLGLLCKLPFLVKTNNFRSVMEPVINTQGEVLSRCMSPWSLEELLLKDLALSVLEV